VTNRAFSPFSPLWNVFFRILVLFFPPKRLPLTFLLPWKPCDPLVTLNYHFSLSRFASFPKLDVFSYGLVKVPFSFSEFARCWAPSGFQEMMARSLLASPSFFQRFPAPLSTQPVHSVLFAAECYPPSLFFSVASLPFSYFFFFLAWTRNSPSRGPVTFWPSGIPSRQ